MYYGLFGLQPIIAEMKKMRKLIEIDAMLDYEGAGANCKHDPSKKPIGCKPWTTNYIFLAFA